MEPRQTISILCSDCWVLRVTGVSDNATENYTRGGNKGTLVDLNRDGDTKRIPKYVMGWWFHCTRLLHPNRAQSSILLYCNGHAQTRKEKKQLSRFQSREQFFLYKGLVRQNTNFAKIRKQKLRGGLLNPLFGLAWQFIPAMLVQNQQNTSVVGRSKKRPIQQSGTKKYFHLQDFRPEVQTPAEPRKGRGTARDRRASRRPGSVRPRPRSLPRRIGHTRSVHECSRHSQPPTPTCPGNRRSRLSTEVKSASM